MRTGSHAPIGAASASDMPHAQAPGLRVSGGPIVQVAEDLTGQALDDRTGPELASLVDQVGLIARAPGDLVAPT